MKPIIRAGRIALAALALSAGAAWGDPAQPLQLLELANPMFATRGFTPGKTLTGALAQGGVFTQVLQLDGAPVAISAMCDNHCSNLDLRLNNAAGGKVMEDVAADDAPVLIFPAGISGSYTLILTMTACQGTCDYAIRMYRKT